MLTEDERIGGLAVGKVIADNYLLPDSFSVGVDPTYTDRWDARIHPAYTDTLSDNIHPTYVDK